MLPECFFVTNPNHNGDIIGDLFMAVAQFLKHDYVKEQCDLQENRFSKDLDLLPPGYHCSSPLQTRWVSIGIMRMRTNFGEIDRVCSVAAA